MKRNYRGILSIALVLLLVAITALTFAYWDDLTGGGNGTINIGEGKTVVVGKTVEVEENKTLIPLGALQGVNDVYEVVEEFDVNIDAELAEGALAGYNFNVKVTDIELNGNANDVVVVKLVVNGEAYDAVDVSVDALQANEVKVLVSINEPTEAEYESVKQGKITYKIEFSYTK